MMLSWPSRNYWLNPWRNLRRQLGVPVDSESSNQKQCFNQAPQISHQDGFRSVRRYYNTFCTFCMKILMGIISFVHYSAYRIPFMYLLISALRKLVNSCWPSRMQKNWLIRFYV